MPQPAGMTFPPAIRADIRARIRRLNLNQKDLAKLARVSEAWLSNLLSGSRPVRDAEGLDRVLSTIRDETDQRAVAVGLRADEAAEIQALLDRMRSEYVRQISGQSSDTPPTAPGEILLPESPEWLNRKVLADLIPFPLQQVVTTQLDRRLFTMSVIGPPQCGKTTILTVLDREARRRGFPIASIDCSMSPSIAALPRTSGTASPESSPIDPAHAALQLETFLIEQLCEQWEIPPPQDEERTQLVPWLQVTLDDASGPPRLMIVERATALGDPHFRRLMQLIRAITVLRARITLPISICIELPLASRETYRKIESASSTRAFRPEVEVGWFAVEEVGELLRRVGGEELRRYTGILYRQYGGQPALTHFAARVLASSTEDTEPGPAEMLFRRARTGAGPFREHVKVVRNLILDQDGRPNAACQVLIQILQARQTGLTFMGREDYEYLVDAHLVIEDEEGNALIASEYYEELIRALLQIPKDTMQERSFQILEGSSS